MSTERLIEAVHERPLLWNHKHPMYRNRIEMKRLWSEIAKELQSDCSIIKNRWKGLRDYYRVEFKKVRGSEDGRGSTWPYFVHMNFLKDSMPTRLRVEGTGRWDVASRRRGEKSAEIRSDATLNQLLEVTIHASSPKGESETTEEKNGIEERCKWKGRVAATGGHSKEAEDDEDLLFFRSLLSDFGKLPRPKKLRLRSKIRQLITDELSNSEAFDSFD